MEGEDRLAEGCEEANAQTFVSKLSAEALGLFGANSLASVLDKCKTRRGSLLLRAWMRSPLTDRRRIDERLDVVAYLVESPAILHQVRQCVKNPDINKLVKRGDLKDLCALYQSVANVSNLFEQFRPIASIAGELYEVFNELAGFTSMMDNAMMSATEIRPDLIGATDLFETKQAITARVQAIVAGLSRRLPRVKLEENEAYGFYLRMSRNDPDCKVISSSKGEAEFTTLSVLRNGISFCNGDLRAATIDYRQVCGEIRERSAFFISEMARITQSYRDHFERLDRILCKIDVLQSFAYAAVTAPMPYVRPSFGERLHVVDCRHPVVEVALAEGRSAQYSLGEGAPLCTSFVPNSITYDSLAVVTGANMGGKSTFIRTLGILIVMAQIGCFIPAAHGTVLPLYDAVMVRVGAGDSILRGQSTFMMEMVETASILAEATPRSFVIIDELGRGTSVSEGFAIAAAVVKELLKRGCDTVFATHFSALATIPGVSNLHLASTDSVLTFKVRHGTCDNSFGINVARMASFPEPVIQMISILNSRAIAS